MSQTLIFFTSPRGVKVDRAADITLAEGLDHFDTLEQSPPKCLKPEEGSYLIHHLPIQRSLIQSERSHLNNLSSQTKTRNRFQNILYYITHLTQTAKFASGPKRHAHCIAKSLLKAKRISEQEAQNQSSLVLQLII